MHPTLCHPISPHPVPAHPVHPIPLHPSRPVPLHRIPTHSLPSPRHHDSYHGDRAECWNPGQGDSIQTAPCSDPPSTPFPHPQGAFPTTLLVGDRALPCMQPRPPACERLSPLSFLFPPLPWGGFGVPCLTDSALSAWCAHTVPVAGAGTATSFRTDTHPHRAWHGTRAATCPGPLCCPASLLLGCLGRVGLG